MKKNSRIYVAGSSGLIGSALARLLKKQGHKNMIFAERREVDLTDTRQTRNFFRKRMPEYVFLAAGNVGGIQANDARPADFIYPNLMIQTNVVHMAYEYGVKKLLFLGCACLYPKICRQPIKEENLLSGYIEPTNESYSVAKISGIKMCQAYNKQYGTNFIIAMGANIYGADDNFGESGHVIASLIKKFHEAKATGSKSVFIWGTGKPRREFLYNDDFADACIFLMHDYNGSEPINVGTGVDTSVKEIAANIKTVVGFKGDIVYDRSKPDGMPKRLLDSRKIAAMGWKPKIKLVEGIKKTYRSYLAWGKKNA